VADIHLSRTCAVLAMGTRTTTRMERMMLPSSVRSAILRGWPGLAAHIAQEVGENQRENALVSREGVVRGWKWLDPVLERGGEILSIDKTSSVDRGRWLFG
jgi:hypothetical protein